MSDGLIREHAPGINSISAGDRAVINISGGQVIGDVGAGASAIVDISGGLFDGQLRASDSSSWLITGGDFSDLLAVQDASLVIMGTGFNHPLGDIVATSGTITGTLEDETPLNVSFGRASTATITLPEPNALAALGSGIAMLALLYRRRIGVNTRRPPTVNHRPHFAF